MPWKIYILLIFISIFTTELKACFMKGEPEILWKKSANGKYECQVETCIGNITVYESGKREKPLWKIKIPSNNRGNFKITLSDSGDYILNNINRVHNALSTTFEIYKKDGSVIAMRPFALTGEMQKRHAPGGEIYYVSLKSITSASKDSFTVVNVMDKARTFKIDELKITRKQKLLPLSTGVTVGVSAKYLKNLADRTDLILKVYMKNGNYYTNCFLEIEKEKVFIYTPLGRIECSEDHIDRIQVSAIKGVQKGTEYYFLTNGDLVFGNTNTDNKESIKINSLTIPKKIIVDKGTVNSFSKLTRNKEKLSNYLVSYRAKEMKNLDSLSGIKTLEILHISYSDFTDLKAIKELTNLRYLGIYKCPNVKSLKGIEGHKIRKVEIGCCPNLESLEGLDGTEIEYIHFARCPKVKNLKGIEKIKNLDTIYLTSHSIDNLSHIGRLPPLRRLVIKSCQGLKNLTGLSRMKLSYLDISSCQKLTSVKGIENMNLKGIYIKKCKNLVDIRAAENLGTIKYFNIDCPKVKKK